MQFEMYSFKKAGKIRLMTAIVSVFALLAGICFAGQSDPCLEATTGREPVIGVSYFGTHFHRIVLHQGENKILTKWPDQLIGSIRLWDSGTLWSEIAIQPGQWKFDRMDSYVEQAITNNATVLYTLGGTPRWASARPDEKCSYGFGCAAEPVRMAHWEEYVRRVAQRYRGRIAIYELWNEPKFSDIPRDRGRPSYYTGSVANMVEMARIARKVLDKEDPTAILSTPGFVNGVDRLDLFLASGGNQYVQAIDYHFYSENSNYMVNEMLAVKRIMKKNGVEHLPLFNTETGVEVLGPNSPPSGIAAHTQVEGAEKLAQYMVLGAFGGIQRYFQYAWDNERSGMFSPSGIRLPAWDAYEKIHAWLLNAKMLGCKSIPPSGVSCQGELSGQRFLIVWAEKEAIHAIPIPDGQRAVSVEKLFSTKPQPVSGLDRIFKLKLGSEPVRILLEAHS